MSHAMGTIFKDGKAILFFEYDGTSDMAITTLRNSEQEVLDHWRQEESRECSCGGVPEKVKIYTNYGHGYHWPGSVCMKCRAIVDGRNPEDIIGGIPA